MTKIKLCGLSRDVEIEAVNELKPEYIGFVFAPKSKRYVTPKQVGKWRKRLVPGVKAVGVFVNEKPETVARLLEEGIVDIAQLHGGEDEAYRKRLRRLTSRPILQAFRIQTAADVLAAGQSTADGILLDSGAGTGTAFDWNLLRNLQRPFFLAGGLTPDNVEQAIRLLHPYAVDVSSGIETNGVKDIEKMAAFVAAVRKEENA